MRKNPVTAALGIALLGFGIYLVFSTGPGAGLIPAFIGAGLAYLAFKPGRVAVILFGHILIVMGCVLVTLGIYLLPHSDPTWGHVFTRPLFWGLIMIFGGICANYHGFCKCVRAR